MYKDTKGEKKAVIGEMPNCGKVFKSMELLWDKDKYTNKEPFEQYQRKAESMCDFLKHIEVYQMKKCQEIAKKLKKDSRLLQKIILSKFESNILQNYKELYEKKVYLTELIQNEENLMTKNIEERYLSEQQKKSIQDLREKRKSYMKGANEKERIYLQIDKIRKEVSGKEKLVEEIFLNVCPTCGHDYKNNRDNQNLSDAIIAYQESFDAMKNILNDTLERTHKEIKNEIIFIQNELQEILEQLEVNFEFNDLILEYERNRNDYFEYYNEYIIMCDLGEEIKELRELKELLEDNAFYKDITSVNQIVKKSKIIMNKLESILNITQQYFAECEYYNETIYFENVTYLKNIKNGDVSKLYKKLEVKIKQLKWLSEEQKVKEMSEKLKELEKNNLEIKECFIQLKKLKKLIDCKNDAQKSYKNEIVKLIEIPLYIYSGKLIQTHQTGLGIFGYTGDDEEHLTQFKFCDTGNEAKRRQDITTRFSAGQKAVVNIALMLALRKISKSDIDIFLIDDPCQSMDELNIASLVEILKNEFSTTQLLISSHEDEIAGFMYYKYSKIGKKTRFYNVQKELYKL